MDNYSSRLQIIDDSVLDEQSTLVNFIFDNVSNMIFTVDQDKKFVKVNQPAKQFLQKCNATNLDELYDELYITDFKGERVLVDKDPVYSVFQAGSSNNTEMCIHWKNGKKEYYYMDAMLFQDSEGRNFAIGILKDVTDYINLKELNNKYQKKADELINIINTISEGVAIVDSERNYMLLNPACDDIFRYKTHLTQKTDFKVGMTFDYAKVMDTDGTPMKPKELPVFKVLEGETLKNRIYRIQIDGVMKYISFSGVPIFDSEGKVEYGVMTFSDVSEIQRHQQRVNQQKHFIQSILDGLGTPVATISYPQYRYELVNDQYCKFIGDLLGKEIQKEELIGKSFEEAVPNHYAKAFMLDADRMLIKDKDKVRQVLEYKDFNNEERCYQIVQSPITDEDGKVIYITAVGIEVTEQVKAKKETEALAKMKEEYFTVISHELRSPIAVVHSAIQMLISDAYGSEFNGSTQKMLSRIEKNTDRLLVLVNNFLDITKAEAGFMNINYSPVQVGGFTEVLLESLQPSALKKSIKLELVNECKTEIVKLDCEKYERVLVNLVSNAIKFTGNNGLIQLILAEDNRNLIIKVKDNGIGIPAEKINKIFDRFYVVDDYLSRGNIGTGIGLSLVKKLVEILKGQINVVSQVGVGSEFILQLPKDPDLN
ncbi:sensor histidine kinase [Alkaliphilus hydrothermalis]|uniref:histidine kinase n=1 Tax=Alkaliphilus hydrothermalis TaxID=1482730 RepID=A0ABS2NTK4_9FIRM|nr:ATP-binding protein [Alkaliphilus hydrothermalis]MBM7616285.1 PAS domain S-box-containing protein [Alkaliphilus hydrothermalis]